MTTNGVPCFTSAPSLTSVCEQTLIVVENKWPLFQDLVDFYKKDITSV